MLSARGAARLFGGFDAVNRRGGDVESEPSQRRSPFGRSRSTATAESQAIQSEFGSRTRILLIVGLMLWLTTSGVLLLFIERPRAGPNDEIVHALMFGGVTLTALSLAHCSCPGSREIRRIVVILVGLAPMSEVLQYLVTDGRSASVLDVGADLVGISVATALFMLLRRSSKTMTWPAVSVGLLVVWSVIAVFAGMNLVRESLWWRCGAHDASPMSHSLSGLHEGPLAEFDGSSGRWRTAEDDWRAGTDPQRTTSADLWCAAIRREAVSVVVVVRADHLASDRTVEIFGSASQVTGDEANVDFDATGGFVTLRVRTRVRPPYMSTLHSRGVLEPPGDRWIAFRYADDFASLDTENRTLLAQRTRISFDDWHPGAPMLVDGERHLGTASGVVRYAGFFARSLTDDELRTVIDNLVG